MYISTKAIASNSDIIKNYKSCREKAEEVGRLFIMKNNQPDAVLFSIKEYERISAYIEYLESIENPEYAKFHKLLAADNKIKNYTVDKIQKNDPEQVS